MAGVKNISSVVEKLEGSLVSTRNQGLEDLKYLLSSSRNGSKLDSLQDDGFHRIFESLYRLVRTDKPSFLKAPQSKSKTSSTGRLEAAATALRLTVEAGVSSIRFKTASSVIDHIIGTLPMPNDDFCEPLRTDYLKSFRILLEHPPFGEHLRPKQWRAFVDFAIAGISISIGDDEQDSISLSGRDVSMTSRNGSHLSLRVSQSTAQRSSRRGVKSSLDDLLGALRSLSTITNAPVMSRASAIVNSVLECLSSSQRAQDVALEIFNNVALVLKTENIELLRRSVSRLVPLLYKLWSAKVAALRDQILVTLSICRTLFVARPAKMGLLDPELREKILDTLENDYLERSAREMLQFDDLTVKLSTFDQNRAGYTLGPQLGSARAVSNWSLLSSVASLVCGLTSVSTHTNTASDQEEYSNKRRKVTTPAHETMRRALNAEGVDKLAALQVLFFLFDQPIPVPEEVEAMVFDLEPLLLNDEPQIVVWAMLLFSRFAWSPTALGITFRDFWVRVWEHTRRATATFSTSRAACLLIDTILRRGVLEPALDSAVVQDFLFAGGKNGPMALSDAAFLMFASILQSKIVDRDEAFESLSMKILGWLELYWVLPPVLDRSHNSHIALHGQPEFLCSLLSAMRGSPLQFEIHYRYPEPHVLSLFESLLNDQRNFSTYLSDIPRPQERFGGPRLVVRERQIGTDVALRLNHSIFDMLQAKSRVFQAAWSTYAAERSSNISDDVVAIVASLCIAIQANLATAALDSTSSTATTKAVNEAWQKIQDLLEKSKGNNASRVSLLSSKVLRIRDPLSSPEFLLAKQFLTFSSPLLDAIRRILETANDGEIIDVDMMDSMESGTSQGTQSGISIKSSAANRRELDECAIANSSPPCGLLDLAIAVAKGLSNNTLSSDSVSKLVDEITGLDVGALLVARQSIYQLLDSETSFARPEAARLLKSLGEKCLQDADYERSEAAICCCAKVMKKLSPLWTSDIDDDLEDTAFDHYRWFIDTALGKGIASPRTLFEIGSMLDEVSNLDPRYGSDDGMPSPRTSLLKILLDAPAVVKYRLSPSLVRMFDRYILTEHGAIFNDIVEALPSDPDNLEGIAVRYYILAELGSHWHTVLRQATYHLFETAIHVPQLTHLGQHCLQKISEALKLASSKELFHAFAPQIIYTWLGAGKIRQMPFEAFGYQSLSDLAFENASELVAQVALRGSREHVEELSHLLKSKWAVLLEKHFAHAEAYCLASQTSLPDREQFCLNSETLIRKDLGTETYAKALREQLPSIIAHLFKALQDDNGTERAFEKAGLTQPLSVLQRICGYSSSTMPLPAGQQPSFRTKFIIEEIQWLCKRTDLDFITLWEPALLIYLRRELFRDANSTLGPLHSASVLRKVRSIISLSGTTVLSGYPLEMLLHNLRPFLTVFQCSEDAIGIYWYLLEAGKEHLQSHLSFLAGLSVSIFASLTAFISSSQESTTQESQFLSTMSKAKDFRKWLGRFLSALEPEENDSSKVDTFRQLVHHAKSMTGAGSSSKTSPEGNVLLHLLLDRMNADPLLTKMHFHLSLSILCKEFHSANAPSDDILFDRKDCARHTSILRAVMSQIPLPDSFRKWAAYVIGRGCSAVGPLALQGASTVDHQTPLHLGNTIMTSASYIAIVKHLENLLWQDDILTAASAERCLQVIATNLDRSVALSLLGKEHDLSLLDDVGFHEFPCPEADQHTPNVQSLPTLELWEAPPDHKYWTSTLVASLCGHLINDPIVGALQQFAISAPVAAGELLPYVVHLVLAAELNGSRSARAQISGILSNALSEYDDGHLELTRVILSSILYLRRCTLPAEATLASRNSWLDADFGIAANAAVVCQLWHEALLFIEIQQAQVHLLTSRSTRRSTQPEASTIPDFTAAVFQNVDDPDFFYAGHEDADLESVIQRLDHESSGYKMLSFQSAVFDATIRTQQNRETFDHAAFSAARALNAANLRGVSQAVTAFAKGESQSTINRSASDAFFDLYDWNVFADSGAGYDQASPLRYLRTLAGATAKQGMIDALDIGLLEAIDKLPAAKKRGEDQARQFCAIATLSEARDLLSFRGREDFDNFIQRAAEIDDWSQNEDFDHIIPFLNGREYLFDIIRRNEELQTALALTTPQSLLLEAQVVRQSLQVARHHSVAQFSLSRATYLSQLGERAAKVGIQIEAASQFDLARTFWSQGEMSAAVKMMQRIRDQDDLQKQDIPVDRSEVLADLGSKVAEARLEPPDEVIANYLLPAYKELGSTAIGPKAGRVFHNFAAFCDTQLQDTDNRDDYERIAKIRETKYQEIQELERLLKNHENRNHGALKTAYSKAKDWYKLDNEEWQRVQANRESLILRCLENYLLSMKACDDFPSDSLRVLSIWLDQPDNERVNDTVNRFLERVPTIKFAGLVNQLTSRLMDNKDAFQQLLMDLMFRICSDHPYHSMYQVFATSKSRGAKSDEIAASRHAAATKLGELLRQKSPSGDIWISVHNASIAFVRVAQKRISDKELKTGAKFSLKNIPNGQQLINTVEGSSRRIPPPTMKVVLRKDRDYSSVPLMTEFEPQVSIAGGMSAPKITTVLASDGSRNKMLLKGGNDDLRQDSIMEQVFEQVSNLLQDHRTTRQRKLGIRTYKVVPLFPNAGIIEFVQNTLPLHDYLLPTHARYFPKDFKHSKCRKEISDAQSKSLQQRVQVYRTITANFRPVMRFFFMEHFLDPDAWFYKRLNYSRSTAAISILGHVLGLGDRHGHNILLDTNTGEVVHIDLGVAFEAGRVLPVPEVVPFRLTRDLVDGMGISGVEGVFRRCCNFTLEALRRDQESIMTILDVLRYDPLYSWSVSPVRLQKMQENAEQAAAAAAAAAGGGNVDTNTNATATEGAAVAAAAAAAGYGVRKDANEPSEADRALTVVAKKLGKSLSVEATVNELIRQATDERNLAVLYFGWAAYV